MGILLETKVELAELLNRRCLWQVVHERSEKDRLGNGLDFLYEMGYLTWNDKIY